MEPLSICESVIAAIVYNDDGKMATKRLQSIIESLKFKGIEVDGLMNQCTTDDSYDSSMIYSINDDRKYMIFQNLGTESSSCQLDPEVLAQSSIVLQEAIDEQVSVLIINKFGREEAEGRGFINEFCQAISHRIIVISLVHTQYLTDWEHFTGGLGAVFTVTDETIMDWIQKRLLCQSLNG